MARDFRLYSLVVILGFFTFLNPSLILAKDIDKPINSPIHKDNMQSILKKNANQRTSLPILINQQNTDVAESESLRVDVTLMRSTEESWIRYSFSATQCNWNVRKPGDYATQCLISTITSNVDVVISFTDFGDLSSSTSSTYNLETYYAATLFDLTVEQVVWYRASDFNGQHLAIPQSPTDPVYWSLWNRVLVKNEISADDYKDDAVITLVMANTTTWTDPEIPTEP